MKLRRIIRPIAMIMAALLLGPPAAHAARWFSVGLRLLSVPFLK